MHEDDVPVLIAGGSLVGLSAAVFLGQHGVRTHVVERHAGTAVHPRAAHFNQRTIELYRFDFGTPPADLSDLEGTYYPQAIPPCPVTNLNYQIDGTAGRVIGHNH